ncbi:MAG: M15 family metallopeptidase [Eubacteriales bacterium]|nr:M15 family metallopeptidase [Eubacteriales bacterium]
MNHTYKSMLKGAAITAVLCVMLICSTVSVSAASLRQVKKLTAVAYGSNSHRVTWARVPNATGYQIYIKDYSSTDRRYKKAKTLKGANKTAVIVKNRKPGKAYAYIVRAYRKTGAGVVYGKLSSPAYGFIKKTAANTNNTNSGKTNNSGSTTTNKKPAAGILVNPTEKQKYAKVFGDSSLSMRYPGGYYKSSSQAAANMTSVTVRTWDFESGKSGKKITRTWTIQVHKNLAETVKQIFEEIYNGTEKFPIHELGGYAWRGGHSEHNTGTAIDINWTENYMVNVKTGVITAGSFWRPGKDPYSIALNGEVARIFKKYGFAQGDWGNSKDYMHFSYFET